MEFVLAHRRLRPHARRLVAQRQVHRPAARHAASWTSTRPPSTPILTFDGDLADVQYLRYELTALGYHLFGAPVRPQRRRQRRPHPAGSPRWSSAPAADAISLSALVFGAARVDGVEINPIIANDVMRDRFRDYSGGIYTDPRVHVTVDDGRSFVRRTPERYDVIQASLVDTWAATAAGAYTLTENTLYTVEAFNDYLDHLTDAACSRSRAGCSTACGWCRWRRRRARARGWDAADRLAIVQHDRVATFLLKKTPFTAARNRRRCAACAERLGFDVLYAPGGAASRRTLPAINCGDADYARLMLAPRSAARSTPRIRSTSADHRRSAVLLSHHQAARISSSAVRASASRRCCSATGAWATGGLTALLMLLAISTALVVLFVVGPLALTSRGGARAAAGSRGWPTSARSAPASC